MVPGADVPSDVARGPGSGWSSGIAGDPGGPDALVALALVSGAILVGRWSCLGSKCESTIDVEARQRWRARTISPQPWLQPLFHAACTVLCALDVLRPAAAV